MVKRATRDLDCTLIFEPGRLIRSRVIYLKRGEAKTFVIVDAGMNDLIRPTLYEAHHDIRPVREPRADAARIIADVAGPVCESGDFRALERDIVEPRPRDLLAVMTAGAYGAVAIHRPEPARRTAPEPTAASREGEGAGSQAGRSEARQAGRRKDEGGPQRRGGDSQTAVACAGAEAR